MIENKLLPSIYLIEITGQNIQAILPGDFGIEKIVLASETFSNDLEAHTNLTQAFEKLGGTEAKWEFNPEFFPSLPQMKLTEEQELHKEAIDQFLEENRANGEQDVRAVTQFFDVMGDFVVSRMTSGNEDGKLVGKIAIEPTVYLEEKKAEEAIKHTPFVDYRDTQPLRIH